MLGFFNERKLVIETRKAVFSQPDVLRLGAVADFGAQKLVRRTELSATTKLSCGDGTPPIANVLLVAVISSCHICQDLHHIQISVSK